MKPLKCGVWRVTFLAVVTLASTIGTAQGDSVADMFGSIPTATFGGSGIPNNAVVVSDAPGDLILGLSAHARYGISTVTNNGSDTFFAQLGTYDPPGSPPNGALWNFAYYLNGPSGTTFELLYDFDPQWNPVEADLGVIHLNVIHEFMSDPKPWEGSENLLFGWLDSDIPTVVNDPVYPSFNPNVDGRYTFILRAMNGTTELDRVTMHVVAGNPSPPIPEPATLVVLGAGLAGLSAYRMRRVTKSTK